MAIPDGLSLFFQLFWFYQLPFRVGYGVVEDGDGGNAIELQEFQPADECSADMLSQARA